MANVKLARASELWDGEMRGYRVDGRKVLLVKLEGEVFAYEDRCAHLGLELSAGKLEGSVLTCSAHHYEYCARTGHGINPASARLRPFKVAIEDGFVSVEVDTKSELQ